MGDKNIIMWVALLALFAACAWWHIRENKHLTQQWQKKMDAESAHWMAHFAWTRTVQLLLALACSIAVIIAYDWQLSNARHLNKPKTARNRTLISPNGQLAAQRNLPAMRMRAPVDSYYPPLPSEQTPPVATVTVPAAIPATPVQPIAKPSAMEDIYNPERASNDPTSNMDNIKKRYEDILVIYMFLNKCGKVNAADYNIITSSLQQELVSAQAPPRLQNDIFTAANGSYKEIYSQSSCTGPEVPGLYNQYTDFIKVLSAGLHH